MAPVDGQGTKTEEATCCWGPHRREVAWQEPEPGMSLPPHPWGLEELVSHGIQCRRVWELDGAAGQPHPNPSYFRAPEAAGARGVAAPEP